MLLLFFSQLLWNYFCGCDRKHEQHMLGSRNMGWRFEVYLALSKNVNRLSFYDTADIYSCQTFLLQGQFFIHNIVKCPQCIKKFGFFYCLTLTLWSAMLILLCYWATQSHKWQHLWYWFPWTRSILTAMAWKLTIQNDNHKLSPFLFLILAGLLHHVHPPSGDRQPHQFFLRQQHVANRKFGNVHPRCLRLPAGGGQTGQLCQVPALVWLPLHRV